MRNILLVTGFISAFLFGVFINNEYLSTQLNTIPEPEIYSIPVVEEKIEIVEKETKHTLVYSPSLLKYNSRLTPEQLIEIDKGIIFAVKELGLNHSLIISLIFIESSARPTVTSNMGAVGLMQVMPGTGLEMGEDIYTIEGNIRAGSKYFKKMMNRYGTVYDALIAYNAGPRRYSEWKSSGTVPQAPQKYAMNVINGIRY